MDPTQSPNIAGGAIDDWLSRRRARVALALLVAVQLWLGLRDLGIGLPYVFHSDHDQIGQAVQLLRTGWFTDSSGYTLPLVWVYAGVAVCAFALLHLLHLVGIAGGGVWAGAGADWSSFVERFADPSVHHLLGRLVGVLCGAALVLATWRLARVRCSRAVSLLAAAVIAVDPVMLLTERQVRPHLPGVLLIVLAAPSILRLALRDGPAGPAGWRDGLRAGLWIGVGTAVFQGAGLLVPMALLFILVGVRPLGRAAIAGATTVVASTATAWLVTLLARAPDAVRFVPGAHLTDETSSLSLPARILSWGHAARFPDTIRSWFAAEPGLILCALAFAALCFPARRRGGRARFDLLLFGTWPLVQLVSMGVFYGAHVRYLVGPAPFLAVLGASLCLGPRARPLRALLVLVLVAMPLSLSVRALDLMRTVDTRIALDALLSAVTPGPAFEDDGVASSVPPFLVAVQDRLVLDRGSMREGTIEFPPYRDVTRLGEPFSPRRELRESGALLYAREPGARWSSGPLSAESLRWLGFELYGTLGGAPRSRLYLPDIPDDLWPGLWRTTRRGPPIELWIASGEAGAALRERLQQVAPPQDLAGWTGLPDDVGAKGRQAVEPAVARALARADRHRAAPRSRPRPVAAGLVLVDLDGDGVVDDVASNVGPAQLETLLALPTDRGTDLGHALGPTNDATRGAPTLRLHGTLLNNTPVLVLVEGARPGAPAHLVFGAKARNTGFRGGVLVPAPALILSGLRTGAQGDLAFAAFWPRFAPAGQTCVVQCWIEDGDGPFGFTATNAVEGTSPR